MEKKVLSLKDFLATEERTFKNLDTVGGAVRVASLTAAEMFLFWDFLAACKGDDQEAKRLSRLKSAMFVAMSFVNESGERYYAVTGTKEEKIAAALVLAEQLVTAKDLNEIAKLADECEQINEVLTSKTPVADAKNDSGGTVGALPIASPSSSVM